MLENFREKIEAPTKDQFEAIYKFSKMLNSLVYEESMIENALDNVIETIDAERGLFVKHLSEKNDFEIIAARNIQKESISNLTEFSSGVLKEVLKKRKPVLYHDAQSEPQVSTFESIRIKGIKSVIGVPVFHGQNIWGIILADSQKQREKFTEQNLVLLDLFSNLISLTLDRLMQYENLRNENIHLQNQLEITADIPEIIGISKIMREMKKMIMRVAKTDATVLITGESGTGKDLAARAIHDLSDRRNKVFLAQFCGSIPDTLLESELFGYKKGAFTGAQTDKKGLLEAANGGTFFLDEIADISLALQAKLLRVLENQEIIRLGDTNVRKINVRIITATNKNLKQLVKENKFREDLLYRLNVFPIRMPALRERKDDIAILIRFSLKKLGLPDVSISAKAIAALEHFNWPGNVRQLINVIQRAAINMNGKRIEHEHILLDEDTSESYSGKLDEIVRVIVKKRIKDYDGNKTLAAKSLGVSRKWIYLKLDEKAEAEKS